MTKEKRAELCALLQAFRPDGSDGVDTVFGTVWDETTREMSIPELAKFYRRVEELQAEIEAEDTPVINP